jgi:hypothetical protein
MRLPALCLALLAALAGCGTEDNTVISGLPGFILSPVRSSISTRATFTDANGGQHPQWVIAMADVPDLCTKLTAHPDYFRNAIENFDAVLVWVPPGNIGTFFVGQAIAGSEVNDEVLVGIAPADGGAPHVVRFPGVAVFGANIGLSQFDAGPGGEAKGNFDVLVADPNGIPREMIGKFKATYCAGAEQAQLP